MSERAQGVRWDLSPLVAPDEFDARLASLKERAAAFEARFREPLQAGAEDLASSYAAAYAEVAEIVEEQARLSTYVELREAADVSDAEARDLKAKLEEAKVALEAHVRFLELGWLELEDEAVERLLEAEELSVSRAWLRAQRRFRPYKLLEAEENALAVREQSAASAWQLLHHETLSTTTVEFDSGDGPRPHTLDELRSLALHPKRELRRQALEANFAALEPLQPVLGHCYDALVADRLAVDALRGLEDPMLASHLDNDLAAGVVEGMMDVVVEHYPLAHRWYRLKAKLLGLAELEYYDLNAPLGEPSELLYDDAAEDLLELLAGLDPKAAEQARRLLAGRRVDAEVRPNKIGGAFCASGPADVGAYLLLNYTDRVYDGLTLAHEMGHALHAELAAPQPTYQRSTGLAVAEVASTFVEGLMFERLRAQAKAPAERLLLLGSQIERAFAAIFRQTMMALFERQAYALRREGRALTPERLAELWLAESRRFLGDAVLLPEDYGRGWSYVPHFIFVRFYTYAYAFADLVAMHLVRVSGEEGFAERYLAFLAAGGSKSPEALLEPLGVDLRAPALWRSGFAAVESLVDEAERLSGAVELPLGRA